MIHSVGYPFLDTFEKQMMVKKVTILEISVFLFQSDLWLRYHISLVFVLSCIHSKCLPSY